MPSKRRRHPPSRRRRRPAGVNKAELVAKVYGTERTDHPGARLWLGDTRSQLVSGQITLSSYVDERPFAKRVMSPLFTRPLIERLKGIYPSTIVYDAKPGAGGRIAADFVKRAPPDGATLLQLPSSPITLS